MIVAAHQPAYLPWLGYLDKIERADLFVVMDDLQYEAQNFQNRNRVKVNNGAHWLTVPLESGRQADRICDKRINNVASAKEHWQHRALCTLTTHYRRAPHFEEYAAALEEVYTRRWDTLLELDMHLLRLHLRAFQIETPVVLASSLSLSGVKSARIVDLCQKVGADVYLSGAGGSVDYLDGAQFERAGIALSWQRFRHPVYPQRYPALGFQSHLAALDLLLNCGPRSREVLLSEGSNTPGTPPGEVHP